MFYYSHPHPAECLNAPRLQNLLSTARFQKETQTTRRRATLKLAPGGEERDLPLPDLKRKHVKHDDDFQDADSTEPAPKKPRQATLAHSATSSSQAPVLAAPILPTQAHAFPPAAAALFSDQPEKSAEGSPFLHVCVVHFLLATNLGPSPLFHPAFLQELAPVPTLTAIFDPATRQPVDSHMTVRINICHPPINSGPASLEL